MRRRGDSFGRRPLAAALDAGADDYLTKPFGAGELLARMRVALRHSAREGSERAMTLCFGDVQIDLARRVVQSADQEVHLTPLQYRLLATLARHAGKVVTHALVVGWPAGCADRWWLGGLSAARTAGLDSARWLRTVYI